MTEKSKNPATIVVKSDLEICIEDVNHAVAEITKMDVVIGELEQEFAKTIFPVDTPKGMKAAKDARQKIRKPRYLIESLRKDGKKPVLELGRKLDGKAKEQTDRLLAIEDPIHDGIVEEENRADREREAKIEAETRRVEAIQDAIAEIRNAAEPIAWDTDAKDIAAVIALTQDIEISAFFEEFTEQAQDAKTASLTRLREMHSSAVAREEEAKRVATEREELEKLRAENAAREAKEKAEREAREAEERKKRDAEEAKRRQELEAQRKKQAEEQARIDTENKRIAEERAAFEREQEAAREREAEARRRKEAEERAEAERKRKAEADAKKARYPGDQCIVDALIMHFGINGEVAQKWLAQFGKKAKAA